MFAPWKHSDFCETLTSRNSTKFGIVFPSQFPNIGDNIVFLWQICSQIPYLQYRLKFKNPNLSWHETRTTESPKMTPWALYEKLSLLFLVYTRF